MRKFNSGRSYLFFIVGIATLLALIWSFFGPSGLGGQASYAIIRGNSMEPLYHAGDLIILRKAHKAEINDVFAYQYPGLGQVIHRIVDRDGERYILQGDNNDWLDGYQPTFDDLIGKAWIHVPVAGQAVLWLREPLNAALLTGLLGGFLMLGVVSDSTDKSKHRRKRINFQKWLKPDFNPSVNESSLFLFSLLLFVSLILGLLSFTRPSTRQTTNDLVYSHSMMYSYTAPADPQVYDQPNIQPGEPLFTGLNCSLDVNMVYTLVSASPFNLSGSYRTLALVSEPNGWKRTVELQPATPFTEGRFGSQVNLDVCQIRQIIEKMTELTGLTRTMYDVSIQTEIHLNGELGGRPYEDIITPSLDFGLDAYQLYLHQEVSENSNPLNWQQDGAIRGSRTAANTLSFLGLDLPVLSVRILSIVGLVVSIAGILFASLPLFSRSKDEVSRIRARYGSLIIHVHSLPSNRRSIPKIRVKSMDELVRLANQSGDLILETVTDAGFQFTVISNTATYYHTVSSETSEDPIEE